MSFKEMKLSWDGKEYAIQPENMLGAIARIEDIITLDELSRYMSKDNVPRARLSMAFGAVLRYAGARVSDEEVYDGMFGKDKAVRTEATLNAATTLLSLMLPPSTSVEEGAGTTNPTKRKARKS